MFKHKYYLNVVNPEKSIVTLKPTKGTLAKAFLPGIVLFAASYAYGAYLESKTSQVVELDPDHPQS